MPNYDSTLFTPPAPLAKVVLQNPHTGDVIVDVPMLMDTGADVSLIPRIYAERLDAPIDTEQSFELMSFDGEISYTVAAQINLFFLDRTFRGLYLLTGQDIGVLGRDILNFVALLIDGPRLTWTDYRPVSAKK
jgi:hypothetical protein